MTLSVINEHDEDIINITTVHDTAITLCKSCVGGFFRYGGRTPVGPRGVVYVSVYGTRRMTVESVGPTTHLPSQAVARLIEPQIKPRDALLLNTSSLSPVGILTSNASSDGSGGCFHLALSARAQLYPVTHSDCLIAADGILRNRPAFADITFGRGAGMTFRLPRSMRWGSCMVKIDTRHDIDFDLISLWEVYETALDRIDKCATGENIYGGYRAVGPRNIVYVYVFGVPPLHTSAHASPTPTHIVARAQIENNELRLPQTSSPHTTEPLNMTTLPKSNATTLRGIPECFDGPSSREHAIPISDFTECATATREIVGTREPRAIYIFSRRTPSNPSDYQLPATFRVGTCVVHLDMEAEDDEDSVRLVYVESTAWVLAHKCSGMEVEEEKWGGTMTVSVGARDQIRVWVYGALPGMSEESPSEDGVNLTEME